LWLGNVAFNAELQLALRYHRRGWLACHVSKRPWTWIMIAAHTRFVGVRGMQVRFFYLSVYGRAPNSDVEAVLRKHKVLLQCLHRS